MSKVLAFDFGASSGRAILATYANGSLTYEEVHRFENNPVEKNGHLCWDFDDLMQNVRKGIAKAGAFDSLELNRAALLASIELAFEYASTQAANANQGGLFDMLDDGHGSSTQEPELVQTTPWSLKERLVQEKTAVGFFLSGHLFDEHAKEIRAFIRTPLADLIDSREPQLIAGIVSDLRFINGNRGKLALFRLDDNSEALEANAEESVFARSSLLKEDALIIAQARLQADRFSGGMRLQIQQIWDLPAARCRFGKHLLAHIGPLSPTDAGPAIARLLQDHPPQSETTDEGDTLTRGLPVRLQVTLQAAQNAQNTQDTPDAANASTICATLTLADNARFYPSDAALASWTALLPHKQPEIIYELAENGRNPSLHPGI